MREIVFVETLYYHEGQVDLHSGQVLTQFENWGPYYKVEFDITVKQQMSSSCDCLHFTATGADTKHGDRYPFFYIYSSGKFFIGSSVNSNWNYYNDDIEYEVGTKSHVVIQQCLENGQLVFKIIMNGGVEENVVNSNPLTFNSMKVYASGSKYPAGDCVDSDYVSLENLIISTC